MKIEINTILNLVIALFIYNLILRTIGSVIINQIFKTDTMKKETKTLKDRINEKLNNE